MRYRPLLAAIVVVGATSMALSGCISGPEPTVAVFEVPSGGQFTIELATPELVEHAQALLAGENLAAVPQGVVVREASSVNTPWSWHIDPATLEFTNITTEACDGIPQYVEDEILTSDTFCPWSARVVAVEEPDA
ncbi:hypothetical protein [Salinibacterium sp. NG253]|uniref:BP74-related protein n=1 Tax=Salinibacterium sp. NG253 TaxID=2792039 RepID=UPI0027DB0E6F|nr:hypothetical protein [Salinibacterium sp. NG253]